MKLKLILWATMFIILKKKKPSFFDASFLIHLNSMSKPFNNKQIGMYLEYESSHKWNGWQKWMHQVPPPIAVAVAVAANQFVLYFLNCKNLKSLKAQYIYLYWKKEFPLFKKIERTKTSFCIAFKVFARLLLRSSLLLLAKTLLFNILQMTGSCTPSKHSV